MKLSMVVPCYNEADNLPPLLRRFDEVIRREDVEVILVDNGSTDSTPEVLASELGHYPFARTTRVEKNQGYGHGILAGLKDAAGTYLGWTHADLQTDPGDLLRALSIIEESGEEDLFVKGTRRGRGLFDNVFSWGMSAFETIYLRTPLWEINAQPTLFHRRFYRSWEDPPHDFSLDLYAYYKARREGLTVKRFPVHFPERVHGYSKWNTGLSSKWKFIKRTLDYSCRLKRTL